MTRTQKRKVEEALKRAKQTLLEWYNDELAMDIEDYGHSELQEALFEALTEGIKKPTKKEAWERVEEIMEDNKDEYPNEDDCIEATIAGRYTEA